MSESLEIVREAAEAVLSRESVSVGARKTRLRNIDALARLILETLDDRPLWAYQTHCATPYGEAINRCAREITTSAPTTQPEAKTDVQEKGGSE